MKRLAAWLLCFALLLGAAAAPADAADKAYTGEVTVPGRFTVRWITPEGYTLEGVDAGNAEWIGDPGSLTAALVPNDPDAGKAMVNIAILREAKFADVERMNDLDEAALSGLEQAHRDEDTLDLSYREASDGARILVIREKIDVGDFVECIAIRSGYEIRMTIGREDGMDATPITEDEIAMTLQFLDDLSFETIAE